MCVKHKQITHHSGVILFALLHHMHSNKPCSGLHSFTNAHVTIKDEFCIIHIMCTHTHTCMHRQNHAYSHHHLLLEVNSLVKERLQSAEKKMYHHWLIEHLEG